MRKEYYVFVTLVLLSTAISPKAASEWKNPDLQNEQPAPTTSPPPAVTPQPDIRPDLTPGTYQLHTIRACNYQSSYSDRGSGGQQDVGFHTPQVPPGYFIVGAYAQGNYHAPSHCVTAVKPVNNESSILVRLPIDWRRVWTDKRSGANKDGSIWHPVSDRGDYACLGSVATIGYNRPPHSNYACIHKCATELITAGNYIWSDRGTGARDRVSLYKLHTSGTFIAVPNHDQPGNLLDLKADPTCKIE